MYYVFINMNSYVLIWTSILIFLPYLYGRSGNTLFVPWGSTAILECGFRKSTDLLLWRGPTNLSLYSIDDAVNKDLQKSKRLRISGNFNEGQYNLAVINFTTNDSGLYRCDTVVHGRAMEQEFIVRVAVPPRNMTISNVTSANTIQLTEGHTTTVLCSVNDGIPTSDMSLVLQNTLLNTSRNGLVSYTFIARRYHHMANLTCKATNIYYSVRMQIHLHVYLSPEVNLHVQPLSFIEEGENVTLTCDYLTNEKPNVINWYKMDINIGSENQSLFRFSNVTRRHSGRYCCQVRNWVGNGTDCANLTVNYKPYLIDNKFLTVIRAEIGHPSVISFTVGSETEPEISWSRTSGGQFGLWKITSKLTHIFSITSTILPYDESHLGTYGVRIRNTVGSIDLDVLLVRYIIGIYPEHQSCNMSSTIEISCNITPYGEKIESIWEHKFENETIRNLNGNLTKNMSVLQIPFCNYRDAGIFRCKWTTPFGVYTSSSTTTVYGQPILIKRQTPQTQTYVTLEVMFYSVPEPLSATWYYKDKIFSPDEALIEKSMLSTSVNITVYKIPITTKGYVATLKIYNYTGYNILQFGCQVKNEFGYLDISFSDQNPSIVPVIPNGMDNATSILDENKRRLDIYFVYGGTATFILIIILLLTITIFKIIKANKRKLQVEQIQRSHAEAGNESTRESVSTANNPSYQEIDSAHYQSVDWENNSFDEVVPEFDENSGSSVHIHYNGLNHIDADLEYVKYNDGINDIEPEYLEVI